MIIVLAEDKDSSVIGEGKALPKTPIYPVGATVTWLLLKGDDLINISK